MYTCTYIQTYTFQIWGGGGSVVSMWMRWPQGPGFKPCRWLPIFQAVAWWPKKAHVLLLTPYSLVNASGTTGGWHEFPSYYKKSCQCHHRLGYFPATSLIREMLSINALRIEAYRHHRGKHPSKIKLPKSDFWVQWRQMCSPSTFMYLSIHHRTSTECQSEIVFCPLGTTER